MAVLGVLGLYSGVWGTMGDCRFMPDPPKGLLTGVVSSPVSAPFRGGGWVLSGGLPRGEA